MTFICLIGVDGAGKTTQALKLAEILRSLNIPTSYVWSRGNPWITRPLEGMGRWFLWKRHKIVSSKFRSDSYAYYLSTKDKLFRNPFVRWIWTYCSLLEHFIQVRRNVYPLFGKAEIVVADRYIMDTVIDIAAGIQRKQFEVVSHLLRHPLVSGLRRPDIIFYLEVDADIAISRKRDIPSIEYIKRREILYSELARYTNAIVINANQDKEFVFRDIFKKLAIQYPFINCKKKEKPNRGSKHDSP